MTDAEHKSIPILSKDEKQWLTKYTEEFIKKEKLLWDTWIDVFYYYNDLKENEKVKEWLKLYVFDIHAHFRNTRRDFICLTTEERLPGYSSIESENNEDESKDNNETQLKLMFMFKNYHKTKCILCTVRVYPDLTAKQFIFNEEHTAGKMAEIMKNILQEKW